MQARTRCRTAAQALVDQLVANGVRHAFCVPGESYLAVLDALRDSEIELTVCRHEGGAAMMAEAVGKATGRPGVCFVTRGPGATNASAGVHIAFQDSTPMILFVGQIERNARERDAFQEMDYRAFFGSTTKWVTELDDADRTTEIVSRAFHTACGGRPGPVVISLPKDMLTEPCSAPNVPAFEPVETSPGAPEMQRFAEMLNAADRPVFVLGGSRWDEASRAEMHRLAEGWGLPLANSYRRATLVDPMSPVFAGDLGLGPNPKLVARVKESDLVVVLGGRMGEIPSQGYTLFDLPAPSTPIVHVHPGAEELGRVFTPALAIHASPPRFVAELSKLAVTPKPSWRAEADAAHAEYIAWSEVATSQPGKVNLGEVMVWLRENISPDTILCNGAGNYASWIHRFYRFRRFMAHVAPTSASMGYGMPAAVAMKRLHADRPVISVNGDGDFMMSCNEFATAVQYRLPIIVIVADNAQYGTIRMHQERAYPDRISGTELVNPDFSAFARSFGGFGATVKRTEDFANAFLAADASGLPSIIHLKISPDAILPGTTLTAIRDKARAG
ncbi:thiamine pyrophosphate-binding protein [Tepidamorphus sp. 3E244]|uniref:thiamine pyrophosphate-binding protein n=1 Tax=Tepidamorphus sp. 3E244 TaxID=3385498 RepID=UPI0038FCF08A